MTKVNRKVSVLDPQTYGDGDPTTYGLPLDQYRYLRDEAPIYLQKFDDPLLVDRVWIVSRYDDIMTVDRDAETFAADQGYVNIWRYIPIDWRHGGVPSVLTLDGDDHRRNRRVLSKGFTPGVVRALEERFRAYAVEIAEEAASKREPFNYVTDVAHRMPMEALGDVLGVPTDDRARFFKWVDVFAAPFDARIAPSFEAAAQATNELMEYTKQLAAQKERDPSDDVMSQLAVARANGQMSDGELLGNVVTLAAGAAESTRTALSHAMHELMRNPEQFAWLRERADDIPASAIQEMVRIATPFAHFVRTATRDVEWHGQVIPKGDLVCMLLPAGNFDPRVYSEPDEFNLARNESVHLGFGKGAHACLGKHVASLEMKIFMEELLKRIKVIRPAGPISYVRDAYSRGVYELPVSVTAV